MSGSAGCVSYPGSPAVIGQPARIEAIISLAWDSGATSVDELDGPVILNFTQPNAVGGGFIGLAPITAPNPRFPENSPYAFAFSGNAATGIDVFNIVENGSLVYGPVNRLSDFSEEFDIIRYDNGYVVYRVDGIIVYTSLKISTGKLLVSSGIFVSGDSLV